MPPWTVAGVYDPPDDDIVMDTMLSWVTLLSVSESDEDNEGYFDLLGIQVIERLVGQGPTSMDRRRRCGTTE